MGSSGRSLNGMLVSFRAAASLAWSAMPAAVTELYGATQYRVLVDLTGCTQHQLFGVFQAAAVAGATLRVQYTTDLTGAAGWTDLDGTATVAMPTSVPNSAQSSVGAVPAAAQTTVLLRVVGQNGNATANPAVSNLAAMFR